MDHGAAGDELGPMRHSAAHVLAEAVLDLFPGTKLGVGPALTEDPNYGFYYDFLPAEPFTSDDLETIEKKMREIVRRNLRYERVEMSKAETEDAKAALIKGGMTVAPPSPELKAGLEKVGATMIEEWVKKTGADGKAIVDAYKKM